MAKKTQLQDALNSAPRIEIPKTATRATSELPPTKKLTVGCQIVGQFQSARITPINDTTTHQPKDVMVYTFRDPETGERFGVLGGRVGLDNAFEEVADSLGGFDRMKGMMVAIERGEDSERATGKTGVIGNYVVSAWTPEKQ